MASKPKRAKKRKAAITRRHVTKTAKRTRRAGVRTRPENMASVAADTAAAINRPLGTIEGDVKTCMSRIKRMKPSEIGSADTLKSWKFTVIDARGLAPTLVSYYSELTLGTNPRIFNYETGNPDLTVGQIARHIHQNKLFFRL